MRILRRVTIALVALLVALSALVAWLNFRGEDGIPEAPEPFSPTQAQIERGAYLARAGNCIACHTARGGVAYAGGLGVRTPFGTVYSTNLTPDAKTGIGTWTSAHFWRALHNGRSKDGRLLYPAFPYPEYTLVTREDADAVFAFLTSLPPVNQPQRVHELRFPYNSQAALAVWRALFFAPLAFERDNAQSADWNRGAYLVRGLGHCVACHSPRNVFGATSDKLELSGGLIPMQGWYAPSLTSAREAGVADWSTQDISDLLRKGVSARGSAMGPMAEVVFRSTQYLSEDDVRAMAVFLKALPQSETAAQPPRKAGQTPVSDQPAENAGRSRISGAKVYEQQCAQCHGDQGEGAVGAYPPLSGNRAVTMNIPANLIRVVLSGGYLPATAGNPRPFGMPPFAHILNDDEVAAVVTYIRTAWGNNAAPVTQLQVMQYRSGR